MPYVLCFMRSIRLRFGLICHNGKTYRANGFKWLYERIIAIQTAILEMILLYSGQQVYEDMRVGLHFVLDALVCKSAHLFLPHVTPKISPRTEHSRGVVCFCSKYKFWYIQYAPVKLL